MSKSPEVDGVATGPERRQSRKHALYNPDQICFVIIILYNSIGYNGAPKARVRTSFVCIFET